MRAVLIVVGAEFRIDVLFFGLSGNTQPLINNLGPFLLLIKMKMAAQPKTRYKEQQQ